MVADVNKLLITVLLLFLFQCRVLGNVKENRGTITLSELRNIVNFNRDAGESADYAKQFKKRAITADEGKNKKLDDGNKREINTLLAKTKKEVKSEKSKNENEKVKTIDEEEVQRKNKKRKIAEDQMKTEKTNDASKQENKNKLDNVHAKRQVKNENSENANEKGIEEVKKIDEVKDQGKHETMKRAEDKKKNDKTDEAKDQENNKKSKNANENVEVKKMLNVEDQRKDKKVANVEKTTNAKDKKTHSTLLQPIFIPYNIREKGETVVDPCIPNPCMNGGFCKRAGKSLKARFHCTCPIEFRGTFCQELMKNCNQIGCRDIRECIRAPSGAVCTCSQGKIDKLCKLDIGKTSDLEKISMVVSKTTRYEVVIVLAVICSLFVLAALILVIHCCMVNSKRSEVCKYYKTAQKNGIFLPPPPDWCDISNDLINRVFFCWKVRGSSAVDKYISKCLAKTGIQLKEDKRQSQMALMDKINQGDASLISDQLLNSEKKRRKSSFKYFPIQKSNSIRELPAYLSLREKMKPAEKRLPDIRGRFTVTEKRRNSLKKDIDDHLRRASVSDLKTMYERTLARRKLSIINSNVGFSQEHLHQQSNDPPLDEKRKSSLISSNISSPMENVDDEKSENIDESKTTKTTDTEGTEVSEADVHTVSSKILSEILQRRTSLRPVKLSNSQLREECNLSSNASLRKRRHNDESRNMNQIWDDFFEQNTDNKQGFESRGSVGTRVDVIKQNLNMLKNKKTPLITRTDGYRITQNNPRRRRTKSEERRLMDFSITEEHEMPEYADQITDKRSKPNYLTRSLPQQKEHISHYRNVNTNTNTNENFSSFKSSTYFDNIRFYETQKRDQMQIDDRYPEKNTANNCNADRSYITPYYGYLIDPSLDGDNLESSQWYLSKDPEPDSRRNYNGVEQVIRETEKDWQANGQVTVSENNVNKYVVSENDQTLQPKDPRYRHAPDFRIGFQEETKSKGNTNGSEYFGIWSSSVQVPLSRTEHKEETELHMGAEGNKQLKIVSSCKENEISAANIIKADDQADDFSLDRMYLHSFQKDGEKLYCIRCDHFDRNEADVQAVERSADNNNVSINEVIGQGVDQGSPR